MKRRSDHKTDDLQRDAIWRRLVGESFRGACFTMDKNDKSGVEYHHIFGRKAFPHMRWIVENGLPLSSARHKWIEGTTKLKRETFLKQILGEARLEMLEKIAYQGGKGKSQEPFYIQNCQHNLGGAVHTGRALWVCPTCLKDISVGYILFVEAMVNKKNQQES